MGRTAKDFHNFGVFNGATCIALVGLVVIFLFIYFFFFFLIFLLYGSIILFTFLFMISCMGYFLSFFVEYPIRNCQLIWFCFGKCLVAAGEHNS